MNFTKKKTAITIIALIIFCGAGLYYSASLREGFSMDEGVVESDVADEQQTVEEVGNSQEEVVGNEEAPYDLISEEYSVGFLYSEVTANWYSIDSRKKEAVIYLRAKKDNYWGDWVEYSLSLDPATRNTEYTTGKITDLVGSEIQYAFNFLDDEFIKGLTINVSGEGTKKIVVGDIRE